MKIPTLLIGLGGIGSKAVENIYDLIPIDKRDGIAVHAFDTNINDIENRVHLKGHITQTSKSITVGQYLRIADDSVKEWFPHEVELLKRKTLTDGAGQIRCVSRLAYRAAMGDNRLSALESQIQRMFQARGEKGDTTVRIMIICSLSGGTGAGMFLQTALYLRELMENRFNRTSILVRGAFILPDILIHTDTVPKNQWETIRANAYACMKELDAISKNAHGVNGVNIEFEYRPDQVDVDGRQSHVITHEHLPFDFVFLYDYLNEKGEPIGSFESYMDQLVRTTYLQLFSPITNNFFSVEDNFIRDLIKGQGGNRYCGAGTSSLIYPYNDIVNYLALRGAADSLNDEWMRLDNEFVNEIEAFEQDIRAGVTRPEPILGDRYIKLLDSYGGGDSPDHIMSRLYQSTRIIDENGRVVGTKAERFLEAVENKIENLLESDQDLRQADEDCYIDEGKIKKKDSAENCIVKMEGDLGIYKQKIFRAVREQKNHIVSQIIGEDCRAPGCLGGDDDYRLNAWILKRPEPVHPVAARYMLYQIREMLEKQIRKLTSDNIETRKGIDGYKDKFDDPETETLETAEDRVRMALQQNVFKKVFKNEFKAFIEDYILESGSQLQRLRIYKVNYLKELVFDELFKAISEIIEDFEHFFRNLATVRRRLNTEIAKEAKVHEGVSDPTKCYLLAGQADKEKTWDALKTSVFIGNKLPLEICKRIYVRQYNKFCRRHYQKHDASVVGFKQDTTMDIFRDEILAWYKEVIQQQEVIDFNITLAIIKDQEIKGNGDFSYTKDLFHKMDELAQPLILSETENTQSDAYWGIHPESFEAFRDDQRDELFGQGTGLIKDSAFPKYELIRYKNNCGLFAEDFSAFKGDNSGNTGSYFAAYKSLIRQMQMNTSKSIVTPHLDKRWHLAAYMPDLNQEQERNDMKKIKRAFINGLIYGRIFYAKKDTQEVWQYRASDYVSYLYMGGELIKSNFYDLYVALFHNPSCIDGFLEYADSKLQKDLDEKGEKGLCEHSFYKGCFNVSDTQKTIMDAILTFVTEYPSQDHQDVIHGLIDQLLEEIDKYYITVFGDHRSNQARKNVAEFINELINSSKIYQEAKKDNSSYYEHWKTQINSFLEKTP